MIFLATTTILLPFLGAVLIAALSGKWAKGICQIFAALTLAVTWGEKSKVDKVTIDKSGEDYIASREGDATAYGLDPKAYADLQQAIAGIKPDTNNVNNATGIAIKYPCTL